MLPRRNQFVSVSMSLIALTLFLLANVVLGAPVGEDEASHPPKEGQKAPPFKLESVDGDAVALEELVKQGPVVLVVLRGYPGYQCPICTRQVSDLIRHSEPLAKEKARVVLVYPGPGEGLKERAEEFIGETTLPEQFHFALDPDYKFTNAYRLRWDAPRETAYPSTFIIDTKGKVRLAHVSRSHGDRVEANTILEKLGSLQREE